MLNQHRCGIDINRYCNDACCRAPIKQGLSKYFIKISCTRASFSHYICSAMPVVLAIEDLQKFKFPGADSFAVNIIKLPSITAIPRCSIENIRLHRSLKRSKAYA